MKDIAATTIILALMVLTCAAIAGWVMNIMTICHMSGMSGEMVVRIIGIFIAPIGAVAGWIG